MEVAHDGDEEVLPSGDAADLDTENRVDGADGDDSDEGGDDERAAESAAGKAYTTRKRLTAY